MEPSVSAKGKGREPGPSYSLRSGNIPGFNVESPSTDDEPENPFLTNPKTPPKKQVKLIPPPVRRSDRLRKPNIQPDGIYGKKSPTSILKRKERKPDRQLQLEIDEGTHETHSQSPQSDEQVPGDTPTSPKPSVAHIKQIKEQDRESSTSGYIASDYKNLGKIASVDAKIFREGGVAAINMLIAKAIGKPISS